MKKKILTLCLVVCLAATAIVGGTLAYFTDTDNETNVFTTGDVEIDLIEKFDPENAKLLPGIDIEKDVTVKNIGSEDAFVRVHIAFPKILDSGDPEFAAYANTLHWNFTKASYADGQWSWNETADGANYPGNGGAWNSYETTIDGIEYTVYVATYETALAADAVTATSAMTKVYLDTDVTNEDMEEILAELTDIKVYVVAEGGQVAGFEGKPYDALNEQFGVPGKYDVDWSKAPHDTVVGG